MKKFMIFCMAFVVVMSCANENNLSSNQKALDLENTLKAYNAGFIAETNNTSRKGKFWKIVGVIAADVAGGLIGGAAGSLLGPGGAAALGGATAAGASAAANSASSGSGGNGNSTSVDPMHDDFHVTYEVPGEFEASDIGEDHNQFLAEVYHGGAPMSDFMEANYGGNMLQHYNSDPIQDLNQMMETTTIQYMEGEANFEFLLEQYQELNYVSENAISVMKHFMDVLFETTSDNQITQLLNDYSGMVMNSDALSYKDKNALFSAFSVARSSANYWNNLN